METTTEFMDRVWVNTPDNVVLVYSSKWARDNAPLKLDRDIPCEVWTLQTMKNYLRYLESQPR